MKGSYIERIFNNITPREPLTVRIEHSSVNQAGRVYMRSMWMSNYEGHGKHGEDGIGTDVSLTKRWTYDDWKNSLTTKISSTKTRINLKKLKDTKPSGRYSPLRLNSSLYYEEDKEDTGYGCSVVTSVESADSRRHYTKEVIDDNIRMLSRSCDHVAGILSNEDIPKFISKVDKFTQKYLVDYGKFRLNLDGNWFNLSLIDRKTLRITSSFGHSSGENKLKAEVDPRKVDELIPILNVQRDIWNSTLR